ncbi:hypothetical protein KFE25_003908 [Diacronema lutheri]|uniref:Uncharacterized protein n=1 Tax=Diacronema lutheri TaxID=2081491 RepID=A0A8J5XI59_DIALT|nr:hypothetical protein KFE25_003908 [Diacronema lutheri]
MSESFVVFAHERRADTVTRPHGLDAQQGREWPSAELIWRQSRPRPAPVARLHATIRRPGSAPHADGALRHAATLTWPDQSEARASLARAQLSYTLARDTLGHANVLRTTADRTSAMNDFRRGCEMPFSYLKAAAEYEQAADAFDELLQEKARPDCTLRRQRMITRARERGEALSAPLPLAVSRTRAIKHGTDARAPRLRMPGEVRERQAPGLVR